MTYIPKHEFNGGLYDWKQRALRAEGLLAMLDQVTQKYENLLAMEPPMCPCAYCQRLRAQISALKEVHE